VRPGTGRQPVASSAEQVSDGHLGDTWISPEAGCWSGRHPREPARTRHRAPGAGLRPGGSARVPVRSAPPADDTPASDPVPAKRLPATTAGMSVESCSSTVFGRRACRSSRGPCGDAGNNPCSRQADQVVALRTARRALAEDDRRRRIRPAAPAPMSSPSTSWPPSAAVVLAVGVSARIDSMTGRGHVRCRSENGTRASCWRAVATASLLGCLVTDAGAGRAPIARRRTLAASTAGAAGWAVRTLASPCEAGVGVSRSAALTGPFSERARRPLDGLTLESGCVLGSTPRPCAGR
jgi:hypothetical protein